jgi:nucleotide-binding universal stress UspA family protein
MKILLATDGSACSDAAVSEVCARPWPGASEVEVLHVIWTRLPMFPDPAFAFVAAHETLLMEARSRAPELLEGIAGRIRAAHPGLRVTTKVVEGPPKTAIVDEASAWHADLIVVGAHGAGATRRLLLGSVSQTVALHAPCSVEIVRSSGCLEHPDH